VSPLILFDNLRVSHLAGNLLRVSAGGRLSDCLNVINELTGSGIRSLSVEIGTVYIM